MKEILFRDPVDFIIFLLALAGFIYWIIKRKQGANISAGYFLFAGYVFYVMYRFAVLYALMDANITDPILRQLFHL